jgi:protein-tyrosine phosphatase
MGINLSALTNVRAEPDERAERLKHSSHVASEIVKNKLYVGGELPAGNLELLQSLGIETVINMSPASVPSSFPNEFQYIAYDVYDTASEDIASLIPSVLRVIHEGGKVYLHCQQGVSRSISMAVAYVMWKDGLSCDAALAYVKARRSIASPNSGFLTRLYEYQAHLSNPAPLRVARFGAYRGDTTFPLVFHDITPPTSNTPSGPKLILDPRTTYAVVLGRDCYLWEGKGCPKAVTAAANATFADLLRYGYYTIGATNTSDTQKGTTVTYTADPTRATSSVQVITDGDEPKAFMTSLKSVIGRPDIRLVSDPIDAFAAYYTDEFIQFVNGGKSKPPPASPRKVEVPAIPLLAPALPTNPSSNTPTTLPDSMSVLHYPDFEEIEIFEFGDFLSTEAYLIIRVSHGHRDLHAWAGRDSEVGNNPDLIIDGYILKEGEDVLQDSSVNVMVEGEETDDFLGLF